MLFILLLRQPSPVQLCKLFQVVSCILFTCPQSFRVCVCVWLSDATSCSRFIMNISSLSPRISHFSKDPCFLLLEKVLEIKVWALGVLITTGVPSSFFLKQFSFPHSQGASSATYRLNVCGLTLFCVHTAWPLCVLWEWMMNTAWSCTACMFGFLTLWHLMSWASKSQAVIYSQAAKVKFNCFKDNFTQMLSGILFYLYKIEFVHYKPGVWRKVVKLGSYQVLWTCSPQQYI